MECHRLQPGRPVSEAGSGFGFHRCLEGLEMRLKKDRGCDCVLGLLPPGAAFEVDSSGHDDVPAPPLDDCQRTPEEDDSTFMD